MDYNMFEIEFEDLKNYEGLYKINKKGEIWSCTYNKIMKHLINESNYLYVSLMKDKIRKKSFIHRLLAIQYIPNIDNLSEVDHIDRNKQNNNLENLRWVTRQENRLNRTDILANKTEEELKIREDEIREYKRQWAENNRRKNGIQEKNYLTDEQRKEYRKIYMANKRASMTEEEKQKHLERRRELYAQKEHSEEYKQKAIERARKHAEKKKLDKSII